MLCTRHAHITGSHDALTSAIPRHTYHVINMTCAPDTVCITKSAPSAFLLLRSSISDYRTVLLVQCGVYRL